MRLIHVTPTYLPAIRYGGPIFSVHGLCAALAIRGHDVEVFTTSVDGARDSDVPHDEPVLLDGVKIRYFRSALMRRLYWAPSLATALHGAIATTDILHLHSIYLWPTAAAAHLARRHTKPYVISPRGMLVEELVARRSRLIKTFWLQLIEKRNLERAAAIHVTSEIEAAELDKFAYRLRQVTMIPNGADAPTMDAQTFDPPADVAKLATMQPLLLAFGRLSWTKQLDRLLEAFALTRRGNLAIVGPDDEGLAPRLQAIAESLGVKERVHLVPRMITGVEKEFVFGTASALVLASMSESFGNVGIEALQRGVPVLTTPATGVSEVVAQSGGGIIVDGDPTELASAMAKLTSDPVLATRLGATGRAYVETHFGWGNIAERMETLYRSLVNPAAEAAQRAPVLV